MSGRNSRGRPFKEVHVEPLWCELGCNRFEGSPLPNFNNHEPQLFFEPEDEEAPPASVGEEYERWQGAPTVANWRLNLIALSHRDNLFFVAYGDKVHVTMPQNVHQTLPSRPDLILRLPRSPQGSQTTGYIDPTHPHCVNHLMVGNLGDFEILLLCCDDGDVIAYYTHAIAAEIQDSAKVRAALPRQKILASRVEPFFHENVGISAWGLAIHERSRLIAVSSNRKEVTVFAFALDRLPLSPMPTTDRAVISYLSAKETFPPLNTQNTRKIKPHEYRSMNYKRVLRLHRMGHNIPSITFSDDEHGVAQSVLAIDILGALWTLNIWDLDDVIYEPYRIQAGARNDRPMGWGVLVLPVSLFKRTKTPGEAFGMRLSDEPYTEGCLTDLTIPFDISDSVRDVRQSSQWHPMFGPSMRAPEISEAEYREATATTALTLQEDDSSEEDRMNLANTDLDSGLMDLGGEDSEMEHETEATGESIIDSRNLVYQSQDASVDTSDDSDNALDSPSSSSEATSPSPRQNATVARGLRHSARLLGATRRPIDIEVVDNHDESTWIDPGRGLDSEDKIILFKIMVNWPMNLAVSKYRPDLLVSEYQRALRKGRNPFISSVAATKRRTETYMPNGAAILRIFQSHVDLQPPTKYMHHTVCHRLLKQHIPEDVLFQLQHIDRLSIHAVIAELNLVVIASQVGRVALLTLTRPEDSWSTNGPVTLFRVELFLPFRKQEDEGLRPIVPLLGMTVGPMQSKSMIQKGEFEAATTRRGSFGSSYEARRRWRLIMHYYDHTILTYEISRNENDELMVL